MWVLIQSGPSLFTTPRPMITETFAKEFLFLWVLNARLVLQMSVKLHQLEPSLERGPKAVVTIQKTADIQVSATCSREYCEPCAQTRAKNQ